MSTSTQFQVSQVGLRLTGKTCVITGGGSGMGRAAVERFLAEGGDVVALDINEEGLASLKDAHGEDHLLTMRCDVADRHSSDAAVDATLDRFGKLDVYFANAGLPFFAKPIEETTDEEWDRIMDVNVKALFIAAQKVVPIMKEAGGGSFVITASMAGLRPRPNLLPYTISKGAAAHMAKAMAIELAPHHIRVNAVCPVAADTPMLQQFGAGDHITANATPLGRLASAQDVAAAALYFASDDGSFITGVTLPVDGGRGI
jgi:3-oxoacyl-[acyl-carrier protein] reductase